MENIPFLRMTTKDLERRDVIQRLLRGDTIAATAASQLCISVRHIKHLKAKAKKNGLLSLIHSSRGQRSHNRLPDQERKKTWP